LAWGKPRGWARQMYHLDQLALQSQLVGAGLAAKKPFGFASTTASR